VDLAWANGVLTKAVIRSKLGIPCRVRCGGHDALLTAKPGDCVVLDGQLRPAALTH
jgi:hypothetical protein